MRRIAGLLALALLTACGTPQEQCISRSTRDLRTLDSLIDATRGNIARGYALVEVQVPDWDYVPCVRPAGRGPDGSPRYIHSQCLRQGFDTETRPRTIDLDAERAKLASMERKRRDLARTAQAAVAQCRATYPE